MHTDILPLGKDRLTSGNPVKKPVEDLDLALVSIIHVHFQQGDENYCTVHFKLNTVLKVTVQIWKWHKKHLVGKMH